MNIQTLSKKLQVSFFLAGALTFIAAPSFAVVDLAAVEGNWTSASGDTVPMWGFVMNSTPGSCPAPDPEGWKPGPELTEADLEGSDLVINLRNCLPSTPVSLMIPGLTAVDSPPQWNGDTPPRIVSFGKVTQPGQVTQYKWSGVAAAGGSYLYQSGYHPALQVHMGLYGALKVGLYENTSGDFTLLYSEIDPELHQTASPATALSYKPRYFLVNGKEELSGADTLQITDTSKPVVLSFLNAGLEFHVPTLSNSYMLLQAEDGNTYPFAKEQYSVKLAAGKTIDAFWHPEPDETYSLYDRHGNNMVVNISTQGATGATAVAVDDTYSMVQGDILSVPDINVPTEEVLSNDTNPDLSTALLVSPPVSGALSCDVDAGLELCPDGSFTYTPEPSFSGIDHFTYKIASGSNTATVIINVDAANHSPDAVNDTYTVEVNTPLNVPAPGVLANDSDPDGDILTVTSSSGSVIQSTGSFSVQYSSIGEKFISYTVCDTGDLCANALITINVTAQVGTEPPIAADDTGSVLSYTDPNNPNSVDIEVTANDTDSNGNSAGIDKNSVIITSDPRRRGTVTISAPGTVTYTPRVRFRGTDTFTYTVEDINGNISNEATVRVNVTR